MNSDILWVLSCGFLVVLMQAGFTALESGMVRAKNSINVAIKNLVDFCISATLFVLLGFGLMFGPSWGGLIGLNPPATTDLDPKTLAFFFFQAMFCGTATTLVSGAVAERMRFTGYFLAAMLISGLIYPVAGHWVWNGLDQGMHSGWLGAWGFRDFAGSTVVHSVGGWVALAAVLVIGPRQGRFGPEGRPIEGHSLPIATLGVFLIWFGWFGFNGGSTYRIDDTIPLIILNTAIAGATGGLAAFFISRIAYGKPIVDRIMNGCLAGLVAITASCHLVTPNMALLIGAVGGAVCVGGMRLLETWEIDDAVGVIPTHLFAGIWGTLALALLAPANSWDTGLTRPEQFGVQLLGVAAIGMFAFCVSYVALRLLHQVYPLRVTPDEERIGLNVAEHGAGTALISLLSQMDAQARRGDFSKPVIVEPETEAGYIAEFYNSVLRRVMDEMQGRQKALAELSEMAHYDNLTGILNRRSFMALLERSLVQAKSAEPLEPAGAVLYIDLDGFKAVNDNYGHQWGDQLLREVSQRLARGLRNADVVGRLGGDEFALLLLTDQRDIAPTVARDVSRRLVNTLTQPFSIAGQRIHIGASIGVALFDGDTVVEAADLLSRADAAMYAAKQAGRACYRVYSADGHHTV